MTPVLSENVGYLLLVGIGMILTLSVILMVKAETKWLGTRKTSEWFYTAGRTIKTGLIASSIISAWTWAATLLQSSTVAYQYGISGPFWYAAGASIQVILFSILAIELKRKAPTTHTFPELVYARYGEHSHKVFLFFGLMTNTIVTAMLILGCAAVLNSLTNVPIFYAVFLIPFGIIFYTVFGGLKATLFAEYINTATIFSIILIFVTVFYFVSPDIGGISGMYEKLSEASVLKPVAGNSMGSYITLASMGALIFGVINIVGNFGTVFVDQSYWQRAIASRPRASAGGFILGGIAWFAIPFALATTLGLTAVALDIPLTGEQIRLGLVAPTAAVGVMGDVGAILILSMVLTAVIAAGSSQLISVSSLMTYDVYRTYLKPSATGRELMRISRFTILGFGIGMGVLALLMFQSGLSLQYLYLAMGIMIGSAVAPISLSILWKKTNRYSATLGAIIGLISGIVVWLGSSALMIGEISIYSTSHMVPLLFGNLASLVISLCITLGGSFVKPENFDFNILKQKILLVDDKIRTKIKNDTDEKLLVKSLRICKIVGLCFSIIIVVVFPASLYINDYVFSLESFVYWVLMAITWAFIAAGITILIPIIEARKSISEILSRASSSNSKSHEEEHFDDETPLTKILVPVDGSVKSLRALNHASYLFRTNSKLRIYLLHVIEWTDENDENIDDEISHQVQEQGRLILRSISIPKNMNDYQRIVKLGNPAKKIAEVANSLRVQAIVMGKIGLGNTEDDIGHVANEVLKTSKTPVVLI
jgi:SSS family transporter